MPCCSDHEFTRHHDPALADVGKAQGVEYTVGYCANCSAPLMHAFAGGVAECTNVVSQDLIDALAKASMAQRKELLIQWFDSLG